MRRKCFLGHCSGISECVHLSRASMTDPLCKRKYLCTHASPHDEVNNFKLICRLLCILSCKGLNGIKGIQENALQAEKESLTTNSLFMSFYFFPRMPHDVNMHLDDSFVLRKGRNTIQEQIRLKRSNRQNHQRTLSDAHLVMLTMCKSKVSPAYEQCIDSIYIKEHLCMN